MNREEAIKTLERYGMSILADLYDHEEDVADAVHVLIPGFEYPDYDFKTCEEILTEVEGE